MTTDVELFDCDTHCYEARDAFTRYLPESELENAITTVRLATGDEAILAGQRVAAFNSERGLGFDVVNPPGSLREMLRQMGSGNPEETYQPEPMRPEYIDRDARMAKLDEQGVTGCILFPGGMAFSAENYISDPRALYANLHSFNRWYNESWGFNHKDRIYATAMLSLRDLPLAIEETEYILDLGAKVVVFPTGPADGRSPGDPYFDPVWARLNEARVVVAFHIMENWYNGFIASSWGLDPSPTPWRMTAWQWNNLHGERPVQDSVSALIFDNLFGRFPNLRVLCAEFGCEWLPHFVRHMDKSRGLGRNGPWIGGPLKEKPSDIVRKFVRVVPYAEDNVCKVVADLGHVDSIVMGSDYPHPEGLAKPSDFQRLLSDLPSEAQHRILAQNAKDLIGTV